MQKPYTDHICRLKQQQQQEPQTADLLDRDPILRAAFDRLLETEGGSPDPRPLT